MPYGTAGRETRGAPTPNSEVCTPTTSSPSASASSPPASHCARVGSPAAGAPADRAPLLPAGASGRRVSDWCGLRSHYCLIWPRVPAKRLGGAVCTGGREARVVLCRRLGLGAHGGLIGEPEDADHDA
eukprot:scaffold5386_cov98-Isochrysis_galbana.AAC.2